MLERFIYKRFCLNEMYANNCAHVRHFCYCRYIYRCGSERIKIACRQLYPRGIERVKIWLIQYKNLISLYILPDQQRVNLRYFDFDQNRLWGATSLYLFSFSLHFTRSTTGKSIFIFLLFYILPDQRNKTGDI